MEKVPFSFSMGMPFAIFCILTAIILFIIKVANFIRNRIYPNNQPITNRNRRNCDQLALLTESVLNSSWENLRDNVFHNNIQLKPVDQIKRKFRISNDDFRIEKKTIIEKVSAHLSTLASIVNSHYIAQNDTYQIIIEIRHGTQLEFSRADKVEFYEIMRQALKKPVPNRAVEKPAQESSILTENKPVITTIQDKIKSSLANSEKLIEKNKESLTTDLLKKAIRNNTELTPKKIRKHAKTIISYSECLARIEGDHKKLMATQSEAEQAKDKLNENLEAAEKLYSELRGIAETLLETIKSFNTACDKAPKEDISSKLPEQMPAGSNLTLRSNTFKFSRPITIQSAVLTAAIVPQSNVSLPAAKPPVKPLAPKLPVPPAATPKLHPSPAKPKAQVKSSDTKTPVPHIESKPRAPLPSVPKLHSPPDPLKAQEKSSVTKTPVQLIESKPRAPLPSEAKLHQPSAPLMGQVSLFKSKAKVASVAAKSPASPSSALKPNSPPIPLKAEAKSHDAQTPAPPPNLNPWAPRPSTITPNLNAPPAPLKPQALFLNPNTPAASLGTILPVQNSSDQLPLQLPDSSLSSALSIQPQDLSSENNSDESLPMHVTHIDDEKATEEEVNKIQVVPTFAAATMSVITTTAGITADLEDALDNTESDSLQTNSYTLQR
jgi:hypothetical protein